MSEEPKDDGNGKLEEAKQATPEQLASERLSRYTTQPDTFIELSELICAVLRNPKSALGISVMIGNAKRSEIAIAQSELNHRIELTRRQMDIEAEVRHQNKIIPAKHGMLDFMRGRK